jgi:hypothetical protein
MTQLDYHAPRFVVSDKAGVVGSISKQAAEVGRAVFDYTCWLDRDETINPTGRYTITPADCACGSGWQLDYPYPPPSTDTPDDTDTLVLSGTAIREGRAVEMYVGRGTPGLSYTVSFLAYASVSGRLKQVNFCVSIPKELVMPMPDPITCLLDLMSVSTSTELPSGLSCILVGVDNTTGGAVTVTLPPDPVAGQRLTIKDVAGNAGSWPIIVLGGVSPVEGAPSVVLTHAYSWVDLVYSGTKWMQI